MAGAPSRRREHSLRTDGVRLTYSQNWPAYNTAQAREKARFTDLLHGLCDGISQPPQAGGRPRLPLADMVFSVVMRVYTTMSGRRAMSDLRECEGRGYVTKTPCYNSVFNYLDHPHLTPLLKLLVEESASPLRALETDFAVDASGFSTSNYARWFDAKDGKVRSEHQWVKAHLMVGVKTKIVTSVEATEGSAHDSPHLPALVEATAARFHLSEVSADKGYLGKRNLTVIARAGAVPYVPFKSNTTGKGPALWRKLWHFYEFHRQDFLKHYHKRSNAETAFSMIKAKFGGAVRSRKPVAQINEILCKVLCHNLCVLVQSIYELGIERTFWAPRRLFGQKRRLPKKSAKRRVY